MKLSIRSVQSDIENPDIFVSVSGYPTYFLSLVHSLGGTTNSILQFPDSASSLHSCKRPKTVSSKHPHLFRLHKIVPPSDSLFVSGHDVFKSSNMSPSKVYVGEDGLVTGIVVGSRLLL